MLHIIVALGLSFGAHAFTQKNNVKNCKDIAKGPCYEFGGRARLYNNKHVRIWKKGSNRLYQISHQTEAAFYDLRHLSMATEINADFNACFLKPEVPSGYSDICIQSVKDIKTSQMPE